MAPHNLHEEHPGHPEGPATAPVRLAEPDAIARRAYELFQERGVAMGGDVDDWLRAEHALNDATTRSELE
jgi:hypothetical protein